MAAPLTVLLASETSRSRTEDTVPVTLRASRAAAVGLAAGALLFGLAPSAQATPDAAAKTLAGMKYSWNLKSGPQKAAECRVYRANAATAINSAVQAISVIPSTSRVLTPAETRSVAVRYLRWACPEPDRTPR